MLVSMKKSFYIISFVLLAAAAVMRVHAEDGIIETRHYKMCPGDAITIDTRQTPVYRDTILYDTLLVTDPGADSIIRYVVNVFPSFLKNEERQLEAGSSFAWCDTTIATGGSYERIYKTQDGCDSIYRLHVTVALTRSFTLCDDESVTFNGQVYSNAGTYYNSYSSDTTYKVIITKHPSQLHQQTGYLDATHPYYWQYQLDGAVKTDTLTAPGVYEYTTHNPETGCNDIWRLILRKDETSYRFDSAATVCENEDFEWRGKLHLNRQGIGTTTDYYDRYKTLAGYDSIYHLALTVLPVKRVTQTIPFCGSITWKGQTYTESQTLIDTFSGVQYGCDSIVTTILAKGIPFLQHDTATIVPGETLIWHGQTITSSGQYEDKHLTRSGCDSIYTLGVGVKAGTATIPIRTERATTCDGTPYSWRGKDYSISGRYVDTVFVGSTQEIDSLIVLELTVHPTYAWTERITFTSFPQTYRGQPITAPGTYSIAYTTFTGCDSILTLYVDREVIRDDSTVTICPNETFIWRGKARHESGRFVEIEKDVLDNDSIEHVLNLTVRYIPETHINQTICRGSSYTFGDQLLTESGVYTHVFKQDGCDSTVVLSLNVVTPDTIRYVHQINAGDEYVWHNVTYRETGVSFYTTTNHFGCDSTEMLILTVNHVDTIDSTATICPGETIEWHGIRASQSGEFANAEQQSDGSFNFYRLHLSVRELAQVDSSFVLCGDEVLSFNGKTYSEAGHFYDKAGCDTLYHLHIQRIPSQVYITNASLSKEGGYTWTYRDNGVEKTDVFSTPGTYEFTSPNGETGCQDIYRLILTKNETDYHFVETYTICEGEDFSWRGMSNLSGQPGTSHYFDTYETRTGKDSIYELVLTVTPVKRTIQTITFCGETTWKGQVLTHSTVVYDTITSSTGCDSIVRVNFDKVTPFYRHDTATIVQGETLLWHGQAISGDGFYIDAHTNQYGCDSTYTLGVGVIAATPQTNMFTTQYSICDGDVYTWRGRDYSPTTTTTYTDTVYKAGTNSIDSIFVLKLTVHTNYPDTIVRHLYTCGEIGASIRYQGKEYYEDTTIISDLHTVFGCDSIVKAYLHFNTALFLSDTVKIADTELPYTWHFRLGGTVRDSVLTTAGTYNHYEAAEGTCRNQEQLVLLVYPTYLYEQDTTICELDLPFYWLRGPSDHINDALQHTVGQTKQYEYRYQSVNHTDSIYRLNLTIDPAPKSTERYYVCEGSPKKIHGVMYGEGNMAKDTLYRDTIRMHVDGTICDSTVYVEVYVSSRKTHTETVVLQDGESIDWNGMHITSGGEYRFTTDSVGPAGCDSISILRVIQELGDERFICSNDTGADVHPDKRYPFVWEHPRLTHDPDTLYTTGSFRDTVYDDSGYILEIYRMDLTIVHPYDTTIVVHGCKNKGALWRDSLYFNDTTFVDRVEVIPHTHEQPCDSVFHVTIKIDTAYNIRIDTTLCEYQLPLVIGRVNPDTIWQEGDFRHEDDKTLCGCDSIIEGHLTIIPKLTHNDSTFICEDSIKVHPVWLGDTITPAFIGNDGGKWADKWQGNYHGVRYTSDTIVWDCNHQYFHHIIVRPSQKLVVDTNFYLCPGDSLRLFWGRGDDTTWFYKDTLYEQHTPMPSTWRDEHHQYTYANDAYSCDSITRWHIKVLPLYHKDTTAHRLLGDSIWWGGAWRYYTGTYDSIAPSPDTSSLGDTCMYIYPLHLIVDTAYYFRDTVDICTVAGKTHTHIWPETGYKQFFTVGGKDTVARHYVDSLITYDRRDSIYDLCVNYRLHRDTTIYRTICEDDSVRFDLHLRDNVSFIERWVKNYGTYYDTVMAANGCDSIITLKLTIHPRIITKPKEVMITDREIPYLWRHAWTENNLPVDSVDTLRATGLYTFVMPSIHGCDSIDSLYLTVHQTHVFRDTIDVCDRPDKTRNHTWFTGYTQTYNTPMADDTAFYADTLQTRILLDSIYVLCVNFHRTYETHLYDTICAGDSVLLNGFHKTTGIYRDTVPAVNGCDSVITLHLQVWPGFPTRYRYEDINIIDTPYTWVHTWVENGLPKQDIDYLSMPGEYGRVLPNIHGCDSIDSLILRIHDNYVFRDTITICSDATPYTWYGPDHTVYKSDIYDSGDYVRRWRTANGFGDSTRMIHIEVLPVVYSQRYDTLCYGDSILFGLTRLNQPRYLHKSGVYYDTLTSIRYGCDSIIEMRLNVFQNFTHAETRHIMRTDTPYVWYHFRSGSTLPTDSTFITAEGTYAYNFVSLHGCDSIDSLTLVLHDDYLYRDSVVICQDQVPYTWYGPDHTIYKEGISHSGEYTYSLRKQDGYSDSTLVRKVTILPIVYSQRYDTLCYGDSILFGLTRLNQPRYLHKSGVYYDTLTSIQYGCDSIIEMRLNVFPHLDKYHAPVDITDQDLPYTWYHYLDGGTTAIDSTKIFGSGEFTYTFATIHGCDSVDHLTVNVHPNYSFRDTVTICSDATPYTWYGPDSTVFKSDIYLTDLYTRHLRTTDGFADSIYTRYVNVQQVKLTLIRDSICLDADGNNFYSFNGRNLNVGGIYRDTLAAASGCDSIIELHLSVNKPYYSFREEHIIEGQTVSAFGQAFTTDTLLILKGLTPSGCDSTNVLKVVVHPLVDTTVTICSADLPYLWANKWNGAITPLYTAGLYRNDTTIVNGQRMYYGLRLIVNQPTDTTIFRTICEDNQYNFNGQFLTSAGEYRDTLRNASGCDSVVILHLNVQPKYLNVVDRTIYEGDSVEFEGTYYHTAGIYPIRLTSSTGCDSIIELRLTVNRLYDDSISVCSNELPYVWREKLIYTSGIYRDTIPNNGTDAVIGIKVNVLPTFRATEPIVISICEGDFYKFGGKILTQQGIYYDTLTATNGCDSIVMLSLQVMPLKYQSETRRIFEGDSVLFDGQWLKESGVYERRVQNANGCTDTYQLILTVLKEFRVDTTAYICSNDIPFVWRGYEYSASGDYSLPTAWTDSSRVVTTLHLTIRETFYEERNIAICSGDEFRYKDQVYTTNGEFFDTIPSLVGCDSIIKYVVSVHPTSDHTFEKHISDKEPYEFHGRILTNTGIYEWTGKTVTGCDSVEHLILTVHPSFFQSDTIELCQSDTINYPFQWKDEDGRLIRTITESGTYNDSVLTEYGFDSVHQVVVHIHPSYFIKEKYEIGEGEVLKIHGRDISKPAVYYDTLRTIHGCDSIYHIVVNPKTTREFTWNKTICQGEYFDFFGEKKTNTGRYTYTSQYKDSIVYLNLTVNPVSYSEKRIIITDKQTSYIYDGQLYTNLQLGENLFTKTMVNQYGCDSIHRLIICVTQRYSNWDPIPLCPGGEVKIDGKVITESGLYTFERRSRVTGELDSLYRVEVYDAPAFDLPLEKATICQGDTFLYGGKKITRAGHYDFTLKTVSGCDSLLHLDLTVNPSYQFYTDATIADYETYLWRGKSYAETGKYDVSFPTIQDCDSTYTLRLTVVETKRQLTDDTICVGQTYNWRGREITAEGIYTDTIRQLETGFSAIYTLKLTILYPTTLTSATVGEVCADGESFDIAFTYTGAKPTTYSIYFDQLAKNEGFKDVLNQPFLGEDRIARAPVPSKKEVIYLEHTAYVKPNRYSMRLVLDNGICGISRSDSLMLLVKYPSWIIEQNWNDVVAPLRKEYNGGFEFAQADWYVNGVLQPNSSLGYLHNDKLKEGDEVVMVATRKGESFSIPTCPLVIHANSGNIYTNPILVYPTQAPHHAPHITIEAPEGGQYAIYSSTGTLITNGTLDAGATRVTLPGINGIYFIRTSVKGETMTHKVMLY